MQWGDRMTILGFFFIFSGSAILGAGIMGILAGGTICDLRAENEELREFVALDLTLAKLKAIVKEPEEDEAA
jgi:hypothetical protein